MNSYISLVTNLASLASLDYHGYNSTIIIVNLVLGEKIKWVFNNMTKVILVDGPLLKKK